MEGLGEPMLGRGERGGILRPTQEGCVPIGGIMKFPCSDDVEEERDLWGEASILPIPGAIV